MNDVAVRPWRFSPGEFRVKKAVGLSGELFVLGTVPPAIASAYPAVAANLVNR
jgi:hypothetical protein